MDEIALLIGGRRWTRWRDARVTWRLGSATLDFAMTLDDRWSGEAPPLDFTPGAEARVEVAGETVASGPVDRVQPAYEAGRYTVKLAGRDRVGQLVDCAAMNRPGEWKAATLDVIARDLAAPFGVSVAVDTDIGAAFAKFTIDEGETAFEALRRAAMHRGVLILADGRGGLALTRAGAAGRAAPTGPGLALAAEGIYDHTGRFSDYIVRGQDKAAGWGDVAAHAAVEGRARDPAVALHRPTLDLARASGDAAALTRAAEANAAVAAGRARRVRLTLSGWRQWSDGPIWRPNQIARANDPWLRLDEDLLIEQVRFEIGAEELRAQLTLVRPDAWKLRALPETEETVGWS